MKIIIYSTGRSIRICLVFRKRNDNPKWISVKTERLA